MTECLDTNQLVTLGAVLEWDVENRLAHLLACDDCRTLLAEIQTLREVTSEDFPARSGFTDQVMNALPVSRDKKNGSSRILVAALNTVLATGTAFFAMALAASGGSGLDIGVPVIALAMLAGVATLAWNAVTKSTRSATI